MNIKIISLFLAVCIGFGLTAFSQEASHVEVLYVSGTAEVCFRNETDYTKAEEGMYLESGDKIRTGHNSKMGLGFDENENNILEVDSDSSAILILKGNEKMELLEGRVFVTIDELPAGASFEIRTPAAVTGVRGTDWVITASADATDIESIDGTPYIKSFEEDGKLSDEETIVLAGYETTVERFRKPLIPRKMPRERLRRRRNFRMQMRKRAQATRQLRRSRRHYRRSGRQLNRMRAPARRY